MAKNKRQTKKLKPEFSPKPKRIPRRRLALRGEASPSGDPKTGSPK